MITRYYSTITGFRPRNLSVVHTKRRFNVVEAERISACQNIGLDFKTQDTRTTPLTLIMMPLVSTLSWTGITRNSLTVSLLSLDTKGAMMCDVCDYYFKLSETKVVDIKGIRRKCT